MTEENVLTMEKLAEAADAAPSAIRDNPAPMEQTADALKRASVAEPDPPRQEPLVDVAMEKGHDTFRVRIPQREHRKALREFKEWKHTLAEILRREARIVWTARDGRVIYQFVLPAKLVRLVWGTTIDERIKLEMARQPEGAARRAVEQIRAEVEEVVAARVALARPPQGETDAVADAAHFGDDRGVVGEREPAGPGDGAGLVPGGDPGSP